MRKTSRHVNIAIDVPILHASGRDVLMGIFHQLETTTDWSIKLYQHEENRLTAETVRQAAELGIDGIIVSKPDCEELIQSLSATPLPVVSIGFGREKFVRPPKCYSSVQNDSSGIGAMGARYLLSLGRFRSFGFIGFDWSIKREIAFREAIKLRNCPFASLRISQTRNDEGTERIARWLSELPKPAAVMLACDRVCFQAIPACEKAGIEVPEQVAMLGIDNDELVCEHTTPTLSSVLPGHEEMGRRAVDEMKRLLSRKCQSPDRDVIVRPLKVVKRESTDFLPPATKLVERAKAFISANACKGAIVRDVVAHLKVSGRLAQLRYKSLEGVTIREALETARLTRVKHLLVATDRRIADIAATCGFRTQSHLAHVFAKRFGKSMRSFRDAHRTRGSSTKAT